MIMKTPKQQFGFSQKILVLSLLAAFGPAHADEEEIAGYIKPASSVSVGLGAVSGDSKDRTIFGQYNGLRKDDAYLLLDVDVVKREDATGLWTNFEGRNLGLDNREMRFSQNKQGDWKYFAEYNEMVRHDPRTINTGLQGAGTTTPTVLSLAAPGTGANLNLDLKRKGITLGAEKWLTPNLLVEASFKNEDKDGSRLSGIGLNCSNIITGIPCSTTTGAMLLLPEPINSTTKQFEAKLNYSGEKFLLSGGYYGSFFTNSNGSLNPRVSGNLWNPDGTLLNPAAGTPPNTLLGYLQQSVALPPDNQAHQLYVSGNYAFTPTTRATFKYAYTHATQNQDFGSMGLTGAPVGVNNLGGVLNSNLAQIGLTARPMAKVSMLANLRYEEKEDETPIALYNGAFSNTLNSSKKLNGKLEASYQLPDNYRATLGVDYAWVHRDRPVNTSSILDTPSVLPLSGLREDTNELGYRAELRRSLSETLNACVSYVRSTRDGYRWMSLTPGFPFVAYSTSVPGAYPMTMMDRRRDKVKVSADWMPTDKLSLQFMVEDGKDTYTGPTETGMRDTGMKSYGIDAALNMSENWKLTGYVNQGYQTLHVDHNVGYLAELENISTTLGIGVVGRPSSKIEMGGDLSYMNDSNRYKQSMGTGAAIIGGGLPDVTYRATILKLFGKYALQKNADIRVDLVHQRAKLDEWTWGYNGTPFTYSDNTTVSMQPSQNVTFLGASYIYKFR
jgi:MtrB/PioB family decaheme-associated outer membrane protein